MNLILFRFKIFLILLIFFSYQLSSQQILPYKLGENFTYNISFAGIKVGDASLKINSIKNINDKSCYQIIGTGKTTPFFDFFFKVRDTYETLLDTSSVLPVKFKRDISEGGFKKLQIYEFNHNNNIVNSKDTSYYIYNDSQDMLSALFFARTFNAADLKINDKFFIPIFMDEENYFLEIKYLHKDTLNTNFGFIECLVFKPLMQEGRVFENGEKMKVWISNDENHILLKVETQIWAGKIEAELIDYSNLKFPKKTIIY